MAPLLVVLNGPIGGGKTTVGVALAGLLEAAGRRVAQIDLDEVWAMVDHQLPRRGTVADWSLARAGAAALADTFFAAGVDVIIVNGPFYTLEERTQLTDRLRTRADVRYVTLTVEFEEALRRTRADPDHRRGISREREWLERKHREAAVLFPALRETDLIVDTDGRDLPTVAALIAGSLARRS
jgi:thymidylate kinase